MPYNPTLSFNHYCLLLLLHLAIPITLWAAGYGLVGHMWPVCLRPLASTIQIKSEDLINMTD